MTLFNFSEKFPDEETCKEYFRHHREKQGVVCKKCGHTEHYWKQDKQQFECKKCKFRTTLKSGTVLHGSKLPFRYWFMTMHLLTSTKKTFSALEVQRQIKHKYYKPIWILMHKLRVAMGNRDAQYDLEGLVEMDEGFFETITVLKPDELTGKLPNKKRGRGSQKQGKVLVMVSTQLSSKEELNEKKNKHKPNSKCKYLKLIHVEDLTSDTINKEVQKNIEGLSKIKTDKYRGYNKLKDKGYLHEALNMSKIKEVHKIFPWVHTAIGNAKKILQGIHHSNKNDYLQNYLNEFSYKFNRRYFKEQLFDRLIVACI